jgi:phage shock protein PspC (stress-responsive transcriptional regulator)
MSEIAPGAMRCPACTSWIGEHPIREWTRARSGRMIAGVARGLSNRFGVPVAAVRLVFLLSVLLGGWGVLVYLALWIAMPEEQLRLPAAAAPLSTREASQGAPP